jgi:hypothetical protein
VTVRLLHHPWDLRWVALYQHDWLWWGDGWCIFLFGAVSD